MNIATVGSSAKLLRGFAIDLLTAHDLNVVKRIMDPKYSLTISGQVFDGRDETYVPVLAPQLDMFPGLCVTVHDVLLAPHAVAMRFTEHGISRLNPGCAAAWGGIALYRVENDLLRQGWAEEDYIARKRQLKSGVGDPVKPPHMAPWDAPCEPASAETEATVRAWLDDPRRLLDSAANDEIRAEGPRFGDLIAPTKISLSVLLSAGNRATFHAVCEGTYRGGFDDIAAIWRGVPVTLPMAGLLTVAGGRVSHAQTSADRLGLHRQLLDFQKSNGKAKS